MYSLKYIYYQTIIDVCFSPSSRQLSYPQPITIIPFHSRRLTAPFHRRRFITLNNYNPLIANDPRTAGLKNTYQVERLVSPYPFILASCAALWRKPGRTLKHTRAISVGFSRKKRP